MALTESVAEIVENSNDPLLAKHDSWERVLLGDIARIQNGFAFKSAKFNKQEGVPLIRIRDVTKGHTETFYEGEYSEEHLVQPRDLLIGMDGDFNCARWRGSPGLLNQRVCRITLISDVLHPRLIDYALPGYLRAIHEKTSAVTVKHLSSKTISQIPLPVPPPEQQEEMVAEIEKQFSRLDEAVASLKRVKANLKRYKAAVLKAAVEGKLTEEWREQNPDVEPASKLLERILAERRSKWEETELAKMKAKGKEPKNDKWKEKYKNPELPDSSERPELPDQWCWSLPDFLAKNESRAICAGPFGTIFKAKDFRESGVPIIFLRHVKPDQYLTHKPGFMDQKKWEELFQEYSVFGGELLITKLGEPPGECAIYPDGIGPAMVTPDVMKMSVDEQVMSKKYLMYYFNSQVCRRITAELAFGTTRLRLTLPIFRKLSVPIPPMAEQIEIVNEVEQKLSLVDDLEREIERDLKRVEVTRQSVLAAAFSGAFKVNLSG